MSPGSPSEKGHWYESRIMRCEKPMLNPVSEARFILSAFTCPSRLGKSWGNPARFHMCSAIIPTDFQGGIRLKRCEVIESTLALGTYRSWFQPHTHPTSVEIPSDVSFELGWLSASLILSKTGSENWQTRTPVTLPHKRESSNAHVRHSQQALSTVFCRSKPQVEGSSERSYLIPAAFSAYSWITLSEPHMSRLRISFREGVPGRMIARNILDSPIKIYYQLE